MRARVRADELRRGDQLIGRGHALVLFAGPDEKGVRTTVEYQLPGGMINRVRFAHATTMAIERLGTQPTSG